MKRITYKEKRGRLDHSVELVFRGGALKVRWVGREKKRERVNQGGWCWKSDGYKTSGGRRFIKNRCKVGEKRDSNNMKS